MQKWTSVASNHVDGSTQITRSGVIRDRHRGNQAADHIDGSRVRLSRYPVTGRNYARICAAGRVLPVLCEVVESGEPSRLASGSGCRAGSMDTVSPGSPEGRSQILASSVNEPHPSAWQSCRPFSYEAWPIIWPVISPSSARNCGS
jgi:hypothetical protein